MPKPLTLQTALTLSLGELEQPIVTPYQIGLMVFNFYLKPQFQGKKINLRKSYPDHRDYSRSLKELKDNGILKQLKGLRNVYSILGKKSSAHEEILCSIDPFAYVSHLSAMEYHGLTDRIPKLLFVSTPPVKDWRGYAKNRMVKDLGEENIQNYLINGLPPLNRIKIDKINKVGVMVYSSLHLGAFKKIRDRIMRVSTIGRTFLDMLKKPDFCGGINHAIDVYVEHANTFLDLIIDEIDQHGSQIDKVRAGYVLEEKCNIRDKRIDSWLKFVQRGGSRKLDPTEDYSAKYSERWCLSINIEKE
ncbi:MAG: hypothetical protein HF981_16290 [Desulfobacteraceae bacterium]|nr:hypothetical protein [Desulfobacteraceae bacterium]MBC2751949.1 hypothetical protein [Desulfobacteraceae bacterium]